MNWYHLQYFVGTNNLVGVFIPTEKIESVKLEITISNFVSTTYSLEQQM